MKKNLVLVKGQCPKCGGKVDTQLLGDLCAACYKPEYLAGNILYCGIFEPSHFRWKVRPIEVRNSPFQFNGTQVMINGSIYTITRSLKNYTIITKDAGKGKQVVLALGHAQLQHLYAHFREQQLATW